MRATNGATRTIRVNNGNGSPWTWANSTPSHNAELMLDLFEAAANNPNTFRLKTRNARFWYYSTLVYYFADHQTEVTLEVRNPGSEDWSLVKIRSYGNPNHNYYATVSLKKRGVSNDYHLVQNAGVFSLSEDGMQVNRMLHPVPATHAHRSGLFNLMDNLLRSPFNVRIRSYDRLWNGGRIVSNVSWWRTFFPLRERNNSASRGKSSGSGVVFVQGV